MLLSVDRDEQFLWLFEDIRKSFMFQVFGLIVLSFLVAYIVFKIKNKDVPKQVREVVGPKKTLLGLLIYVCILVLYALIIVFQVKTGFDLATMGFINYMVKFFELVVLFFILICINTVVIIKTNWFSKKL